MSGYRVVGGMERVTTIIHDTDLHGLSCGVNAYYALRRQGLPANVYSHFDPRGVSTAPATLAQVVENLGLTDLIVLDIPIDVRNPKQYVDALVSHAQYKGRVLWLDHHGHSGWVDALNKSGVIAVVFGTSFDLSMAIPRMYGTTDGFVEKWALIGAISDFDASVADKVSPELELDVADTLDQAYKTRRDQLMQVLGIAPRSEHGNIGALSVGIVERGIEPERVIEAAKALVQPLPLPRYETTGPVVYTTQLPAPGLAWKTAWKLCLVTNSKVAVVPTQTTNGYAIIFATYWRAEDAIRNVVDTWVQRRFAGKQIVGHPGARSVLVSQGELENIPALARELSEEIDKAVYTPRTVTLISDKFVAQALHADLRAILARLAEILETQRAMYQEYLELKRRQVELLERIEDARRRAD